MATAPKLTTTETAPEAGVIARGDIGLAHIESLNYDGRGVARVNGKVTFIDGALPGEDVRFRYYNKRPAFDTGVVRDILRPSAERVAPPCPHFGVCGGCSLQHLQPAAQVRALQQVLAETLEHVGAVQPQRWLSPIVGSATGYRRRARLGVRFVPKKGGVLIGFREKRRSFITALNHCLTLDPRVAELLPALQQLVTDLSVRDRLPQIEVAAGDQAVALVFRHLRPFTPEDLLQLRAFAIRFAVQVHLQPAGPESIAPLWPQPADPLTYELPDDGVTLAFRPTDFVQVNAAVNRQLVQRALALLDLSPADRVLDLFCGLGNFTLAAARRAVWVHGIEADAGLIERAQANAAANRLDNVVFTAADLFQAQPAWAPGSFNKLLLDPPRAGAIEALKALAVPLPERIVYVSCNPATLARDSAYLVNALGYRFDAAGVADMFPHTSHVESLALFVRP